MDKVFRGRWGSPGAARAAAPRRPRAGYVRGSLPQFWNPGGLQVLRIIFLEREFFSTAQALMDK